MSWSKIHPVTRRAFLGGGAAAIALPWLESLLPAAHAGPNGSPCPVRLIWVYIPNGIMMQDFTPAATGPGYDLPRILAPLAPVQSEVSVLTGLANMPASVPVAGDHARGTGSFLSCVTVEHTAGDDIRNGVSIDQVVAQQIGDQTLFPSLELGTSGGAAVGDCDSGYSCAYTRNISWADETTPMAKTTDPALLFDRLFAGFDVTLTEEDRERRKRWRTSVLDSAVRDIQSLQTRLSVSDRAKLDEYLTGVRELEQRIQSGLDGACVPPDPPASALSYTEQIQAFHEIVAIAMQCDLTRVVTLMYENAGSNRSFDFLGVTGAHHELSHHQDDPATIESLVTIDTWEVSMFVDLVQRLQSAVEPDGSTVLDNALVCFSSEISDGNRHNHDDLPVLLAGRGGGVHAAGQHVVHPERTPVANLYLAMAQAAGASVSAHGDSTGILDLG
ncbi:MAG: DUF1552 domain-containing protein [Deltaproteobacteria bacterium]|nr:MAG: DUF1552 domain-containing protein [Deltaproteobacteria bacterium]